ncbi:MAG: glycosyltransferase family 39 protein [Candidatus Firestonebacteria bacterium]
MIFVLINYRTFGANFPIKANEFLNYILISFQSISFNNLVQVSLSNLLSIVYLFFIIIIAYYIGRKILKVNNGESSIYALGLGFCIISVSIFLLGVLGLLYQSIIYILFFILLILSSFYFSKNNINLSITFNLTHLEYLLIFVVLIFFILNFICCLTPETFYDSLLYHLAVPSFYLLNHKITNIPNNVFSNFPQNIEMLYLVGLSLNNEILAKLINLTMGVLTIFLVYFFVKKNINQRVALLSVCMFYSIPMISTNQINTQIDIGLTFYVILSLFCILNWIKSNFKNRYYLILGGLFSGFSLGIKYSSIFFFIPLILIVTGTMILRKLDKKIIIKNLLIFIVLSSIFILPWLVKNLIFNNNPFYPYFSNLPGLSQMLSEQKGLVFNNLFDFIKFPWTLTINGMFGSSNLGAFLLLSLPLFLLPLFKLIKQKREINYLLIVFVSYLIICLSITKIARFFIPGILILCIIFSYYIYKVKNLSKNNFISNSLYIVLFVIVGTNFIWISALHFRNMDPLSVILGIKSKSEYLSIPRPTYPNPSYPVIEYINNNLPDDSKVLFIGETRGYYCHKLFITNSVFDKMLLCHLIENSVSVDDVKQKLIKQNIKYVLINSMEIMRLRTKYSDYNFEGKLYSDFFKSLNKKIYSNSDVYLYEIVG